MQGREQRRDAAVAVGPAGARADGLTRVVERLKDFMRPPAFPGDEDKTRTARVLNALLLNTLFFVLLALLGIEFIFQSHGIGLIFLAVILLVGAVCHQLMHVGHVQRAATILVLMLVAITTAALVLSGRVGTTVAAVQVAVTVIAGLLLGDRAAMRVAGWSVAVSSLVTYLELTGYESLGVLPVPPQSNLFMLLMAMILTQIPLVLTIRMSAQFLARARSSEQRFQALFNEAPVLYVTVRMDNGEPVVTNCNAAFLSSLGYSRQQVIGTSLWHYLADAAAQQSLVDLIDAGMASGGAAGEYDLFSRHGQVINALVRVAADPGSGPDTRGALVIFLDVSARRAAEQALHTLNATLERRVEERTAELNASVEDLEAFNYSVAHDLRSPLRGISGISSVIEATSHAVLDDEGKALFARIRAATVRMHDMVEALLRFSRLGRQGLVVQAICADNIVSSVLTALEQERVETDAEVLVGRLPDCAGDPQLVQQVWSNLIANAIKYSRNAHHPSIRIGGYLDDGDGVVTYFVKDNGVGFDMQYAAGLFRLFQRLHRETEFSGNGVGLAIVERIVTRHGGRVWAESQPGKGASFYFTLPDAVSSANTCIKAAAD